MKNFFKKLWKKWFQKDPHKYRLRILKIAKDSLGETLCNHREYGGPETVNNIVEYATGRRIGGTDSSSMLHWLMENNPEFFQKITIEDALPGDIINSPTGSSTRNFEEVGKMGIIGEEGKVYSVDREDGIFKDRITLEDWKRFAVDMGFPIYIFRAL